MATTTPGDNLPMPEVTDRIGGLEVWFSSLASSVQDAINSRLQGLPEDKSIPGLPAASNAERDLIYPLPVQGDYVYRTDKGFFEAYYGTYNSASNPGGRSPAGWYPVESATLPAPKTVSYKDAVAIKASSWANIPHLGTITLELARPAWVDIRLSAWVGAQNGHCRAGVKVSGATSISPHDGSKWGQVLFGQNLNGRSNQQTLTKVRKINAGKTTFQGQAYKGGSRGNMNYPVMEVVPLRWA